MLTVKVACIGLMLTTCASIAAQQENRPLSPPSDCGRKSVIVYDGDMGHLLATMAEGYKVVVGFETVPYRAQRNIKISACFETIDNVIDTIIGAAPEYDWKRQDGFIDIHPKGLGLSLLDSLIPELQLDGTEWSGGMQAVINVIESRSQLTNVHLSGSTQASEYPQVPLMRFSVDLKDVTVRRALSAITKASGNYFWTFQITGTGRSFVIKNSMR